MIGASFNFVLFLRIFNKGSVFTRLVLDRYPFQRREFFKYPFSVEAAESGIFFTAEWHMRFVVDGLVVDVDHAGVDAVRDIRSVFNVG